MNLAMDQLTTAEKLRIMEDLWDDLCRHAEKIPSPSWHQEVLSEREKSLSKGSEAFTDWEIAKKRIRKTIL